MKTFLILYCAFAYGFEFSSMLDFIFNENVHNRMKDECPYPLPYILSFLLFLIIIRSPTFSNSKNGT